MAGRKALPAGRKPVQLHVSSTVTGCYLIALADDGTMWQFRWKDAAWVPLPDLPVTPAALREFPKEL